MSRFVVLTALILIARSVLAQPPVIWETIVPGFTSKYGYCIELIEDDGYVVAGVDSASTYGDDAYLVKMDLSGSILWSQTYNYLNHQVTYGVVTYGSGINREYVLTGYKQAIAPLNKDVIISKTDYTGSYIGSYLWGDENNDQVGRHIQRTSDGGFIIVGWTNDNQSAGDYDILLLKRNSDGSHAWANRFGGVYDDKGYCVKQTDDNGYIITGYITNANGNKDAVLIKTNSNGELVWQETYTWEEGQDEAGHSVLWFEDASEDIHYVVCGYCHLTNSWGGGLTQEDDVWAFQVDDDGDVEWSEKYGEC